MPRSKTIIKRVTIADPVYNSRLVTKLINKAMHDGKKSVAAKQVYAALEKFEDPAKILETVIATIAPKMEVRSRRVGGASYQVPSEVRGERKTHLALKWLLEAARSRSNKEFHTFAQKLEVEMKDAMAGTGGAIKKRDMVQKMAEANRVFAHLKW
ncbi:MAG: 30S ribosomal protein S7 [Patescibacteria group bacterium]|nr:30S ribosomal protein S7 [Patescibacteria group bacterium]MCL5432450.1 30S ribosomal protein S7 [Patescibacteria group bacterium]